MISTVLFDMNDVLCRYDRSVRVARLAELSGGRPDEVEQAIWGSGFEDEGDAGLMDADAYLAEFGRRLNVPLLQGAWADALRAAITPIPETLALAHRAGMHTRTAVLTNNNLMVKRLIGQVFPELDPIFGTGFYVSAEFRAKNPIRKPTSVASRRSARSRRTPFSSTTARGTSRGPTRPGCERIFIATALRSRRLFATWDS